MMTNLTTSSEGKRNKKTKALNGLLTATAIGLFLEGCSTGTTSTDTTSTDTTSTDTTSTDTTSTDTPSTDTTSTDTTSTDTTSTYTYTPRPSTITSGGSCTINGRPCSEYGFTESIPPSGQEVAELLAAGLSPQEIATLLASQESSESSDGSDGDLLASSSETETLESGGGDSVGYGSSDEDNAEGEENSAEGENSQEGSEDNDVVVAENDDSIGEGGSDVLQGSAGADTYVFTEDGGANTIIEVAAEDVVNTLKFEGDYEVSDFSFERGSENGRDLIVIADTDGDGQAENEITLADYFVSETGNENLYTIMVQINDGEAFTPSMDA